MGAEAGEGRARCNEGLTARGRASVARASGQVREEGLSILAGAFGDVQ